MKTSKLTLTLAALTSALAISAPAFADPFMNINFDADTPGNPPATSTNTTLPITQPYSLGGYSALTTNPYGDSPNTPDEGTILVGSPDGMSNAAVMTTNPTDAEVGALYMDTEYSVTSQSVQLSFDLDIKNQPASATGQLKTLNGGPSTVGILLGINNFQAGNTGFDFAAAPTSAAGGVFAVRSPDNGNLTSFFNYSLNTPYHIEIDANYDTGLMDTYVNGALEASGLPMASGIVPNANPDETFIFLNGEAGYANEVAIDNIEASVPEPASLSVLGLGACALLARRRRA